MSTNTENTEEKVKISIADHALLRRSKLIYFVLNLALLIPFAVKNYSHWGMAAGVAVVLLAFYFIVVKPTEDTPVSQDVPLLLFFDVCFFLAMLYQPLIDNFRIEYLEAAFSDMKEQCIYLIVAGFAMSLFTPKRQAVMWLKALGKSVVGAAVVFQIWSNGEVADPVFYRGGDTFLAFYLLCSVIWVIFCTIACYINPASYKRNNWLTTFLLIIFVVMVTTENQIIQAFIPEAKTMLLTAPTDMLAWWKVILSAVVLLGCALVAYDFDNDTLGADALCLASIASAIVLLKILVGNYFSFSWVVFAVFIISSIRCLRNEQRQAKTLKMSSVAYLAAQFVTLFTAILFIKHSLWINAVVVAVYTMIFYNTWNKKRNEVHKLRHWLVILSAPAVYAIALIWQMRFSMDTLIMILLAYAVFAGAIIILSWPHPDNLSVPKGFKMLICCLMVLLCWIAMTRHGSNIDIEFQNDSDTAVVSIEARGKENSINSVEYYWSDITGENTSTPRTMPSAGTKLKIEGEKLTVIVVDSYGVRTTVTDWYPSWLLSN